MTDLPPRKIDVDDICWIIGVVYADGSVKSVIKTFDDPHISDTHDDMFGIHGTRWRVDNTGEFFDWPDHYISTEEIECVRNYLVAILGPERCKSI